MSVRSDMNAKGAVFQNTFVVLLVIILLSLWTSLPIYLYILAGLSDGTLFAASLWEGVVLLFPLPGLVATGYGYLTRKRVIAILVGLAPYAPTLFLGFPVATLFFIPGISNGLFGLGGAILRGGDKALLRALVIFLIGAGPWIFLVASLMR